MSLLFCSIVFNVLITISNAVYSAYITTTGNVNNICSEATPCGHFQHALDNVVNNEEIIITIDGINPRYDTYCHSKISGNVTFKFDTTKITTAKDWFGTQFVNCDYWCDPVLGFDLEVCQYPLEISADANVQFYGLIWDVNISYYNPCGRSGKYDPAVGSWSGSTIYCSDCIFRDGSIELRSKTVTFYNSIFDDFIFNWFGGDPKYRQVQYDGSPSINQFILRHDLELNIINSTVKNIADTNFVKIASDLRYKNTINVYNSTIASSTTFLYVENAWTYAFVRNKIHFESLTFIDSDNNGLIVLYVEPSTLIDISIHQINISYSQYIRQSEVSYKNLADNEVIHIESANANVDIINSIITTLIHCSVKYLQVSTGRRRIRRLGVEIIPPPLPWCNCPYPFLMNNGVTKLENIWIRSNFNSSEWKQYFFDIAREYENSGINYLP
eukprot:367496_1